MLTDTSGKVEDYLVGTNSNPRYVAEARYRGIVGPGETLLGIFDGVFYDSANKRIGGIALSDFLVITDRAVITWARDQYRDYVDRFPLSNAFVVERKAKDSLQGTLKLGLVLPEVEPEELDEGEKLELVFDLVPLPDLEPAANLIEVLGNAHRDLIKGGAGEEDRYRAARVIFSQVFLSKYEEEAAKAVRPPERSYQVEQEFSPGYADDEMMTPLSRLDRLGGFEQNAEWARSDYSDYYDSPPPPARQPRVLTYNNAYERGNQVQFYRAEPDLTQGYYSSSASGQAAQIEQEIRWLNQATPVKTRGARRQLEREAAAAPVPSAPGARLRDELNSSEALFVLGRSARAVFDNLGKLRQEAETKGINLVPFLSNLRDSGMNIRDLTEFLLAANDLLDTVSRNPAARELAVMFANRAMGEGKKGAAAKPEARTERGPAKAERGPVKVEEADGPEVAPRPTRVKVERRKKPEPVPLEEVELEVEPVAQEVDFTRRGSQTKIIEDVEEPAEEVLAPPPPPRPVKHRLAVRGGNTAGAADGGPVDEPVPLQPEVDLATPRGPDLN